MATPTGPFRIEVEGVTEFQIGLSRFGELVEFMPTSVWDSVAGVFFKDEEEIFRAEGRPEAFKALSPKYEAWKMAKYPGMPIMQLKGATKDALTGKGSVPGKAVTIKKLVRRKGTTGITMGVRGPYQLRHQFGRAGMPQRKIIQPTAALLIKYAKIMQAALVKIERESFGGITGT
ncbi:hypothetical protein DRQ25_09145 [Candidatus Fermentibacteria bacterium]|nr:MAG: hypothetical protein DRQ25_09145 [Candidatus Fermentibacteria bacterium]